MSKSFARVASNPFLKSVATLVSGSVVAQGITLISSLIFARIYTPEQLGVYTLILTAESLFGSIICLRYDVLVVAEENRRKLYALIKLCCIVALVLSVIIAFLYGGYHFVLRQEYRTYTFAIPFILLMLVSRGAINILDAYNNNCREYGVMSSAFILRTVVQNAGAIILGLLGCGVFGIVFSHTVGLLFGTKRQAKKLLPKLSEVKRAEPNEIRSIARANYRQPLYSAPSGFANRYSYSSISLFIEMLFGAAELGYYSISYKALGLPLSVLSNNVAKVFYREASKEYTKKGKFFKTLVKTSVALAAISLPMGLLIYYLVPWGIGLLLGDSWLRSARFVQILIPMFCVRFVVNAVAQGLQVVKKQSIELLVQFLLVSVSVGGYLLTKTQGNGIEFYLRIISLFFSGIYVLYFGCIMYYSLGRSRNREEKGNEHV